MKLAIIISTGNLETNWNALRLANFAAKQGDEVKIFLVGQAVEYESGNSEKFNIQEQVKEFLLSEKAQILACGTCLKLRNQEAAKTCPINTLKDLYSLIKESDKILTF
ncbi:sulfur reduction protein DsrE [bacterium (Candidatus Gribaldobacteria) CG08_land_8_20_14_0_20_39_15]|uniref:Sulfur reduction protein DsrE n=1 Tax=bacterium (Candidatus Gribaldobacteria) CG08_land_8_20_14_0_20_39_15 TaxID=2014273 RepID=A0A2M6XU07_9BACT|nr:MAG: sulfur reduction protein DsrE [bacterium (Candidatus Gribaldobacteria) CG08_land_8_20_14_0_20_39_15]